MSTLLPADRVEIQILVDNATDGLSTTLLNVETEFAFATRCCAVHGLSCLITVHSGDAQHSVLFDSGPEDYAFERNTTRLGADLGKVEGIVLSHGHWDHSGAMLLALGAIRARNGNREVPYYAHPGMFRSRGMKSANAAVRRMDDVPSIDELTGQGARVICTTEPQRFLDDMFYVSGEIPRVTPFERGLPGQVRRTEDGNGWEPDELLMDERWLAVHAKGKGLIVFSACSHAGIVNVLKHGRASFPDIPLYAVIGGLHLSGINEEIIPQTIDAMKAFHLTTIAAGHCTGWRAISALAAEFGDKVVAPTAVGKRFTF
jgi:7,8-dihydropterin-6-yl-methyl-4-(beta-D-ribofuranosyl)aminobenzene 5'-phosphate synthase